jgi:citrate lyase beta subunit
MSDSFEEIADRLYHERLEPSEPDAELPVARAPVHVVYGGANLFKADTPQKFGAVALGAIETFAPNFVDFANAMWLKGADTLPRFANVVQNLEFELADDPDSARSKNPDAWFAWTVYNRVVEKLKTEPVEDFRIDFEDGYGIRQSEEEDAHAVSASTELAKASGDGRLAFCGFRIKSLQHETYARATRTLKIFLDNFLGHSNGAIPANFVVTLPKINSVAEVEVLVALLDGYESQNRLAPGSIGVEMMIETPFAVANAADLARAGRGRVTSAHFGAFDYTAAFGITADHQHLHHDACRFARQQMQLALAPLGLRLSDSVTTDMPVPVHRGPELSPRQESENRRIVHAAWRKHFNNVTRSLINGFYQSWDLHPAQLAARYGALYSFFLESADSQAARLRNFVGKATQALMTGNLFDDAASAQGLLNFFLRAASCGAMTTDEIKNKTGLSEEELRSASFAKIMEIRNR